MYAGVCGFSSCNKSFAIQLVVYRRLMSMRCLLVCETNLTASEADPRDQGLPSHRKEEDCPFCEDQEEQGCCQVQGALLQVLVHPLLIR